MLLRVCMLCLQHRPSDDAAGVDAYALAADLAAHPSLTGLAVTCHGDLMAGALDALVDAALARRLASVALHCHFVPAEAPALARLLRGDALRELALTKRRMWPGLEMGRACRCWPMRSKPTPR